MNGDRPNASPPARLLLRLDMQSQALESSPTGLLSVAEIEHLRRASIADFDSFGGDDEEEITTVIARLPSDAPPADEEEAFVASLPKPVAPPSVRIAMGPVAPPRGARAGVFGSTVPLAPPSAPRPSSPLLPAPPSSPSHVRALPEHRSPPPAPSSRPSLPPTYDLVAPKAFPPGDSVFPPSTLAPRPVFDPYAPATMTPPAYQWSIPQPTVPSPAFTSSRDYIPRWAKVYFAFVAVILAASAAGWIVTR